MDAGAPESMARGDSGGALRGLSPRAERVARSAMEAMLADEDADGRLIPGAPDACERAVRWLTLATGQASGDVRRGFGLLTFFLQWLPLFVLGTPRRMTSLPLADRLRYLEALETSRVGLLTMLLLAFKVPMGIAAFEEGAELRSTGFDRPDTTSRRGFALAVIPPGDDGAAEATTAAEERRA